MKVFEILARALAEGHRGPLFGLLGDANLYVVDAFVRQYGGAYVGAAHEGAATLMALGYASVSGTVGFASVTHGPAVTNTLTALAEGVKSHTPIVLLCGDTPVGDRENLQNINQRDVIIATGAGFEQLRAPQSAAIDLARAVRRAFAERRPVALNIPAEFLWQEADYVPTPWHVEDQRPEIVPFAGALENAVGMLASARRPIVLAGRGAVDGASRAALLRLAERLEAPLASTLRAKDLFAGENYDLGTFGTLSSPDATDAILRSDCVIAFGASLTSYTTSNGAYLEGKKVIQVSEDRGTIGSCHVPDIGLVGTPEQVVERFLYWLDEAEILASGFRGELNAHAMAAHPAGRTEGGADDALDWVDTLDRLEQMLPANKVVVTDAGRFLLKTLKHLHVGEPRFFVPTANFGSIGLGMGYALGAAAAEPERPVVLVVGDGGFMLGGLSEFHTAVRQGTDLIVLLCNDGAYGAEHIQLRDKGMDTALSRIAWPEFAPLAQALGADGITVRNRGDLVRLGAALSGRKGPILVDLKLDPDSMPFY